MMTDKEMIHLLQAHLERYPMMQISDVVKLLYQSEFGPGHLISDPLVCLNRLKDEYAYVEPDDSIPLIEDIGDGFARIPRADTDLIKSILLKKKGNNMKALVAYFSAESGRTAKVAKDFVDMSGADLFEIVPEKVYSKADLNWMNPMARCNREHALKKDVPVLGNVEDFSQYDVVFVGFPIWYGCAPNVVNTFCSAYDWAGKKVYAFATSGGSGIGKTAEKLLPYVKGAEIIQARLVSSASEMKDWL